MSPKLDTDGSSGLEPLRSSKFTAREIETGLAAVAVSAGNTKRAARLLAERGLKVSRKTLWNWREKMPLRYEDTCRRYAREIEQKIASEARELVASLADVERLAMEKARAQLEEDKAKDPAAVGRNLSTMKGINLDKMLLMEGRPTQIEEHRDADELLRKIRSVVTVIEREQDAIEGEAEDVAEGGN